MGTTRFVDLFLIRHGVTKWNLEKRYLGHTDQELDSEKLAELEPIKAFFYGMKIDLVYASDLQRCVKTFHYLYPNRITCLDNRLREIYFGEWEGCTHQQLESNVYYQAWLENWEKVEPPNGEGYPHFAVRVLAFLHDLFHGIEMVQDVRKVALVTHGGVIRRIMTHFLPTLNFNETGINHGRGIQLTLQHNGGDWTCSSWSEVPFLEKGDSSVTDTII
ncbi:histidine phosphatase family protein [Bacillus sp. CGMCC 1.16607]|uniref:histidine phosphatase family protein n=1 Tax=Bacillus sp. CGMCC 1.16607 TaxID=3351842 RepID=UPI0036372DB4